MKGYQSLNKFLVRRPSGSLNQFNYILQENDLKSTAKRIFDFFETGSNSHALFLASPDLFERFQKIKAEKVLDLEKHKSLLVSLYKYMARMNCRPTPFGILAGCGVGEIADSTHLQMGQPYTTARLDMDYLFQLEHQLGKCPVLRFYFKYHTNSTLWKCGDSYRFIERKFTQKGYKYIISAVDSNEYLDTLINSCQGSQTLDSLVSQLILLGIPKDEATAYILQLIDHQILIDQLTPSVCGDDYFNKIFNFLQSISDNPSIQIMEKTMDLNSLKRILSRVQQLLLDLTLRYNGASNDLWSKLFDLLDLIGVSYQKDKVIQTELFYRNPITVDTSWLKKVRKTAEYSAYFSAPSSWNLANLSAFMKKFVERYEEREVSLLEVLDSEVGIGYLQHNSMDYPSQEHSMEIKRFLAKKWISSKDQKVMEIFPEELKQLSKPYQKLSDTLSAKTELYQTKEGKDFLYFEGGGFISTGAGVIARFSYGNELIHRIVSELNQHEEKLQPNDFILAEVDHIPEGRSGNVLSRPSCRKYVINYMVPPSSEADVYSIPLEDLMISVHHGMVLLRSKKLNKYVIPRITTAHNHHFGKTQPIYQLLGDIQFQNTSDSFRFNWGELGHLFNRFPRVVCDGNILSKAIWVFEEQEITTLIAAIKTTGSIAIDHWRQKNQLPRQVFWAEDDRKLLIDFENELSIETFISLSKNEPRIILHENLSLEYLPMVTNEGGEHCQHEVIWFYKKQEKPANNSTTFNEKLRLQAHINNHNIQRDFLPGREWTYIKMYCGQHTGTQILQKVVQPLVHQYNSSIDKWFFIRYFDTGYHIRFRVKWKQGKDRELFLSQMHEWIVQNDLSKAIHKILLDTYSRELERYDPVIINQVEALFHRNSELVLALYNDQLSPAQIKLAAFKYIDSLLDTFGLSIGEQEALLGNLATAFGQEFGIDKNTKKRLSQEFKVLAPEIDRMINTNSPLGQLIDHFIALNDQDISEMLHQQSNGLLSLPLYAILGSILHMFINRLYATDQRYQEMQIYQLLHRYYRQKSHWSKMKSSEKKIRNKHFAALNIS